MEFWIKSISDTLEHRFVTNYQIVLHAYNLFGDQKASLKFSKLDGAVITATDGLNVKNWFYLISQHFDPTIGFTSAPNYNFNPNPLDTNNHYNIWSSRNFTNAHDNYKMVGPTLDPSRILL